VRPAAAAAGTGISLATPVAAPLATPVAAPSLFSRLRGSRGVAVAPEPLGATPGPAPSLFSRLRGSRGVAVAPAPAGGSKRKTKKNKLKSKKH
jgi:Tfp pilus assembly protein FimT